MHNELDDLKNMWQNARETAPQPTANVAAIIQQANQKKGKSLRVQWANIIILLLVLLGLSAFFVYVAPLQWLISRIGIGLMTGGLFLRIIIELGSIYYASKIDLTKATTEANETFLRYFQFRKRIHGPVTMTIVALYTIGFYLLTPEFSEYFSTPMMILIDGSYIVGATIFIWSIRSAIRREMGHLREIQRLQLDMTSGE